MPRRILQKIAHDFRQIGAVKRRENTLGNQHLVIHARAGRRPRQCGNQRERKGRDRSDDFIAEMSAAAQPRARQFAIHMATHGIDHR